MAITSGSYTIGSGGDYATLYDFEADISWGLLTGNLSATFISDVTETNGVDFNGDNGTYDIHIIGNHDYLITLGAYGYRCQIDGAGGDFYFENLNVKNGAGDQFGLAANGITNAHNIYVHDCLVDMTGVSDIGIEINDSNLTAYIYNNVVWGNTGAYGMSTTVTSASVIENNTVYTNLAGTVRGVNGNLSTPTYRNNVIVAQTQCWFNAHNATAYNNASNDTTGEDGDFAVGSGNISNINPEAEFISTDPASPHFLKPTAYGKIANLGLPPTYATSGINGVARPHRYRSPQ